MEFVSKRHISSIKSDRIVTFIKAKIVCVSGQMDGSGYGITVCAVVACTTYDKSTCGLRNESLSFDREWHSLQITSTFPTDDHSLYFPTTLDTSIMPFKVNEIGMTTTFHL